MTNTNKTTRQGLTQQAYVPPSLGGGDKPTFDMYGFVQSAFDHFNVNLFNSELPQCLLTLQREKNVCGYFSNDRWEGKTGTRHEIALNPYFFVTEKPLELFQTIVHEMCHLWQHEYGKPSRGSYHNKEWADKMESIGLMPSETGEPGGKRTGQKMGDYPIKDGKFYTACVSLANQGHVLPYVDRIRFNLPTETQLHSASSLTVSIQTTDADVDVDNVVSDLESNEASLFQPFSEQFELDQALIAEQATIRTAKQKTTFQCPECGDKAWGKATLNIICGNCHIAFEVI